MNLDSLLISIPLGTALAAGLWLTLLRPMRIYSDPRISAYLADISEKAAVVRAGDESLLGRARSLWVLVTGTRVKPQKIRAGKFHQLSQAADFLELLQMSLVAGESIDRTICRLSAVCGGSFGRDIRICAGHLRLGMPLVDALNLLASRAPILEGVIRQIEASAKRGTPVASVLTEAAIDLRGKLRERMIEESGKKEISMMIPLVFGIMPLSVLFAVYPGLAMLNSGF